jgi:KipI family sensor histidine kinase inhibitor
VTHVERMGDAALLVTLGDALDPVLNARALGIATALEVARRRHPGIGGPVPGHASLLVPFDPDLVDESAVRTVIAAAEAGVDAGAGFEAAGGPAGQRTTGTVHEIHVRYGGPDGPDLADVATATGLTEREVVALHAGVEHRVLVLGFQPGFAYLGGLPAALELPRRATPRVRVPAGSVAIAGRQTGMYPFATPGGWHVIGRTDARLWDPAADPPARLAPGDRVRFISS